MVKPSYVSSLPPLILVKLSKEINKISKFFKKKPITTQKKSYVQASSNTSNIAREMLKIKEAFSSLQDKKIELIQKIISGSKGKHKPCINMTTKRPLHK